VHVPVKCDDTFSEHELGAKVSMQKKTEVPVITDSQPDCSLEPVIRRVTVQTYTKIASQVSGCHVNTVGEQLQRLRLVLHFDKLCDEVLHKLSLIWGFRRSSPCKCTFTPHNGFCNKEKQAVACISADGMSPRLRHGW